LGKEIRSAASENQLFLFFLLSMVKEVATQVLYHLDASKELRVEACAAHSETPSIADEKKKKE
jgi:hypothetical protein